MRVIIQKADEIAEHELIAINDEWFDVLGWVNLEVGDKVVEVHAKDLHRALLPFLDAYYEDKEATND